MIKKGLAVAVILLFIGMSVVPSTATGVDTDIDYNNPPTAPIFLGPTRGVVGEEYRYTINSTDPDGDDVYYIVFWEPGVMYEWFGPYPSGEEVNIGHTWDERGTYYVFSAAMDTHNDVSNFTILDVIIGEIIYVDDDNTEGPWNGTIEYPYQYIQDGIDNASCGDTAYVYSGIYHENVSINKSINLFGEDKTKTIIDEGGFYGNEDVINVSADEVTISGFSLTGSARYHDKAGIKIQSNHNTIYNNNIYDNERGVYILNSSYNNKICNNTISNNAYSGIYLYNSSNNTLNGNTIVYTGPGIDLLQSSHNIITGNKITSVFVGIHLEKSSINAICNNYIKSIVWEGIMLWRYSDNNSIMENTITNGGDRGIFLQDSNNNDITNNTITNNELTGISIIRSSHNNISHNLITNNERGIGLAVYSNDNIVSFNTIANNDDLAMFLSRISNSSITNNICANSKIGIFLWRSYNNLVVRNNFMNNSQNVEVEDSSSTTIWDDGILGNYWDDYMGSDKDGDGIGDTPKEIEDDENNDSYPLMVPYGPDTAIRITTPLEGYLYLRNIRFLPISSTIVFGNIKIKASAANYQNDDVEIKKVEFYVDGLHRWTDTKAPYNWRWRLSSHIKHRHIISVIAYDDEGNTAIDECQLWKFF